ncbi:MAG: hypothetical protein ABW321_26150 [Polyangiales bacterium]
MAPIQPPPTATAGSVSAPGPAGASAPTAGVGAAAGASAPGAAGASAAAGAGAAVGGSAAAPTAGAVAAAGSGAGAPASGAAGATAAAGSSGGAAGGAAAALPPCPTGWMCENPAAPLADLGISDGTVTDASGAPVTYACGNGGLVECNQANPAASCPELSMPFCAHVSLPSLGMDLYSCAQHCTP